MIVVTSETIVDKKITKTLGLVRGNTIRARHLGKDILALFRNIIGGEISEYTKLMGESREQAIDRMIQNAEELGANAIITARLTTSMLMGGAAEIVAYGTAVVVEEGADSFLRAPTAGVRVRKGAEAARRRRFLTAFSRSGLGGSLLEPGLPSEHGRPTLASHRNPKRKRGHTLLRIAPNPSLTLRVTMLRIPQGFRADAVLCD